MWTKKMAMDEAARGEGCLGKARDDEPVFIIVGDDITMSYVLEDWAYRVEGMNHGPTKKSREARAYATEIRAWQRANAETVKVPD
jgi:hypothetical protein